MSTTTYRVVTHTGTGTCDGCAATARTFRTAADGWLCAACMDWTGDEADQYAENLPGVTP